MLSKVGLAEKAVRALDLLRLSLFQCGLGGDARCPRPALSCERGGAERSRAERASAWNDSQRQKRVQLASGVHAAVSAHETQHLPGQHEPVLVLVHRMVIHIHCRAEVGSQQAIVGRSDVQMGPGDAETYNRVWEPGREQPWLVIPSDQDLSANVRQHQVSSDRWEAG